MGQTAGSESKQKEEKKNVRQAGDGLMDWQTGL